MIFNLFLFSLINFYYRNNFHKYNYLIEFEGPMAVLKFVGLNLLENFDIFYKFNAYSYGVI